jgi:hypothetical protein
MRTPTCPISSRPRATGVSPKCRSGARVTCTQIDNCRDHHAALRSAHRRASASRQRCGAAIGESAVDVRGAGHLGVRLRALPVDFVPIVVARLCALFGRGGTRMRDGEPVTRRATFIVRESAEAACLSTFLGSHRCCGAALWCRRLRGRYVSESGRMAQGSAAEFGIAWERRRALWVRAFHWRDRSNHLRTGRANQHHRCRVRILRS